VELDGHSGKRQRTPRDLANANLSDRWMYPIDVDSFGRPIDAAWAESRMRSERLIEMKHIKGPSKTAGRARLQPVQIRDGRRLRFPQHRRAVPPEQLLWRARDGRRNDPDADGRAHFRRRRFAVHQSRWTDRGLGGGKHAASLWDAMYRKETFGVPMGADLPPMKGKAPNFVLWAAKHLASAPVNSTAAAVVTFLLLGALIAADAPLSLNVLRALVVTL
jgi:hypothetical protein